MAATRYPIGVSSFEDGTRTSPHGKVQTVTSLYLAQQVRSAAVEFDRDVLKNNGEHLSPNEGVREIPRQQELFDGYQRKLDGDPAYANYNLAAYPGTSTHGPQIGTAVDFGITRKDGSNRALVGNEWTQLYRILERRGIRHTGATFRVYEAWHCNGIYAAELPPITNAPLMATKQEPDPAPEPDDHADKDDDMKITWDAAGKQPTLWVGEKSWDMANVTVAGVRIQLPQTLGLVRRLIRADQSKDYPEKFNELEKAIIKAAIKKAK
jgi:hypothetical protein